MSGDTAAAEIEKGFWFVSTPQLDAEELSWQFGSSASFSYSQYVVIDKHPGLHLDGERRKAQVFGRSADAELEWKLLALEGSAVLSCPEKRVAYYLNACHDKAFEGGASLNLQDVRKLGNSQWNGDGSPAQNAEEQLKISPLISDENRWVSSQSFQFALQSPKVDLLDQPHKLTRDSMRRRHSSFVNFEGAAEQPEKLGEALCHSQTRARNAEKLVSDIVIEKEKLAKLLFKEANTCRTYKERAQLSQLS
ncbi:hypothetical protein L7F22_029151 [Adiantum nelumboides]|nr:hypothetical protein [Adiantum nelumboides]